MTRKVAQAASSDRQNSRASRWALALGAVALVIMLLPLLAPSSVPALPEAPVDTPVSVTAPPQAAPPASHAEFIANSNNEDREQPLIAAQADVGVEPFAAGEIAADIVEPRPELPVDVVPPKAVIPPETLEHALANPVDTEGGRRFQE